MFDVIVVGTRVSGSSVAMLLARSGLKVLAVDGTTFPSDTISTHYIHQAGLSRLQDWGLLERVIASGCPPVQHLNFSYTDIALSGMADPIDGIDAVYCPRRTVLDTILVDAAREAGVELIEGFTVRDLIVEGEQVVGIRGSRAGGGPEEFRGGFVVGADGANSTVAKRVGATKYDESPGACFVYYSYYSGLDWGMQHRTGFGEQQFAAWPTNDDLYLVAVMRKRDRLKEFRKDPDGCIQEIVDAIDPKYGESLRDNGTRVERLRPMTYPDNYRRTSFGPGWALVGDAGYHKDPFTGWGITDAFKYGEMLAHRLVDGLGGQRPLYEALAAYQADRDAQSAGTYELTKSISELTLTPYYDSVFRAASKSPEYTKKFFGLIAGGYPGEEFFNPENLAELYATVDLPVGDRHLVQA
jgi:flavin-dependent dehydrogenase